MHRILLATGNRGKLREFERILPDGWRLDGLCDLPGWTPPLEDAPTFAGNAAIKALAAARGYDGLVIADDSGLEVDALGGRPGVHSARFAGEHADDAANRAKLLAELARPGVAGERRSARFRCVIVAAHAGGQVGEFEGVVEGAIARAEAGGNGFGYDPLFIPDGYSCTFAQLDPDAKHAVSHRGRAFAALLASGLLARFPSQAGRWRR